METCDSHESDLREPGFVADTDCSTRVDTFLLHHLCGAIAASVCAGIGAEAEEVVTSLGNAGGWTFQINPRFARIHLNLQVGRRAHDERLVAETEVPAL